MIELGPFGFLRTLLVIVLFYYGAKFLFRWWVRQKVNSAVKNRENMVSQEEASYSKEEKGKVHIKKGSSSNINGGSGGEYVDYEEVD